MIGNERDRGDRLAQRGPADARPDADLRDWLLVAAALLVIASLVPPLSTLARRYLWAETLQFSMFAMVCPALIVLGAPWRRLPRLAGRLAARREPRPSFPRGLLVLVAFIGVSLAWRVPPALNAVAQVPGLVAVEAITLLGVGTVLWLELVPSPPVPLRLSGPQRAVIAAGALWSTWIVAYALGFASGPVIQAYARASGLGAVADQEIAVGLVWGVAGICFLPVIFAVLVSWLKEGGETGEELRREFPDAGPRPGVRGWDRPQRKRGARSG